MFHGSEVAIVIQVFAEDRTCIISKGGTWEYSVPVEELTTRPARARL